MHDAPPASHTQRLAQERRLAVVALDQMNDGVRPIGQCTRQNNSRKTAAAAEIDPDAASRRDVEKLERVGDVPDPDRIERRRRNQIGLGLPGQQQRDIGVEPRLCFT